MVMEGVDDERWKIAGAWRVRVKAVMLRER